MAKPNKKKNSAQPKSAAKGALKAMAPKAKKPVAKAAPAKTHKAPVKAAPPAKVKAAVPSKTNTVVKAVASVAKALMGKGTEKAAPVKAAKAAPAKAVKEPPLSPQDAKAKKAEARRASAAAKKAEALSNMCREVGCEVAQTSAGYCRLHYIKNWKKIKRKEQIMKEGRLNQYIEELVAKYPEKYIEAIRMDLANDKDFMKVIRDLELDESIDEFESEGDAIEGIVENIRRDVDDDDVF